MNLSLKLRQTVSRIFSSQSAPDRACDQAQTKPCPVVTSAEKWTELEWREWFLTHPIAAVTAKHGMPIIIGPWQENASGEIWVRYLDGMVVGKIVFQDRRYSSPTRPPSEYLCYSKRSGEIRFSLLEAKKFVDEALLGEYKHCILREMPLYDMLAQHDAVIQQSPFSDSSEECAEAE